MILKQFQSDFSGQIKKRGILPGMGSAETGTIYFNLVFKNPGILHRIGYVLQI